MTSTCMAEDTVRLHFALPSARLAPYVSTFYHMQVALPDGETLTDQLHPEWGNVRLSPVAHLSAGIGPAPVEPLPRAVATGPTSYATTFTAGPGRSWGIGLLPLGWLTFMGGAAADHADRIVDVEHDPACAAFAPLLEMLFDGQTVPDTALLNDEAVRIDAYLLTRLADGRSVPPNDAATVSTVHETLVDGKVASVADLAQVAGLKLRTMERLSRRAFGFTPKLLLRRQRFLRSLARFMLDPELKWLNTLDDQYFDQAQFVRDFHRFIGMAPRDYAATPHPVLMAAAKARAALAGDAVQALHRPSGPAASSPA